MSDRETRYERWWDLYLGLLLGIVGNFIVESFFGLVRSFNIEIPPIVWFLELVACLGTTMFLLRIAWARRT